MPQKQTDYENNPFYVALNGLNLLFDKAKNVAIFLVVLSVVSLLLGVGPGPSEEKDMGMPNLSVEQWLVFGALFAVIIIAAIFIGSMLSGIGAYTAARLARGHEAGLKEAFHAVLNRLFSYIWLQIIVLVKVVLWSLLLFVPGFIMSYRYSLANVAFFDKDLKGDAAVKESLRLTKGAWFTTFASLSLFNMITLGVITELLTTGAKAILYRQYTALDDKKKPDAHMLSWLTLAIPIVLIFMAIALLLLFAVVMVANGSVR